WYVLTETGSVTWLAVFGSLLLIGTLLSPMFGVMGDRIGHRRVLSAMRAWYAVLAAVLTLCAMAGLLSPWLVCGVALLSGLVRPSDMGMRNALIAAGMPAPLLMGAMGIERMSADSARVIGALTGAGLVAFLGIHWPGLYGGDGDLSLRLCADLAGG
ncbi:MAG: MFS transporter, partial [Alphaproteobacteria bacterium]|nr:MFS transporter [Alphaproteobacteria bacterium]